MPVIKENNLTMTHPNLIKEWDVSKNGELKPEHVTSGSDKVVWWQCIEGHEFNKSVYSRTHSVKPICPTCKKNSVPNITVTHPHLIPEWHPTKNPTLKPEDITSGSGKEVWWKCSEGHEWLKVVNSRTSNRVGCPECEDALKPKISHTHPHLIAEWHPTKNGELKPENVMSGSAKRIWWLCEKGHEWDVAAYSRTRTNSGCPECYKELFKKRKRDYVPPFEESIAFLNPRIASEWHPSKNGRKGPECYTQGSNIKSWWQCKEGHEWDAVIFERMKRDNLCPYCTGRRLLREKSFGYVYPELAIEWHPTKNKGKTPFEFAPLSHKKAWFKCAAKGHEWEAYIGNRARGKGCPYCSGHKPTDETSLLAMNPRVCEEWDYEKNDKTPNEYKPFSNEKVWWTCSKGHNWDALICSRNEGQGCPECSKKSKTSFPEQAILFYLKKIFPDAEGRKKLPFLENNMEADIYIDSLNLAIEYDGYHHKKAPERDERKNKMMQENDVQLIRVRQFVRDRELPEIKKYDSYVIPHDYESKLGIKHCVEEIFEFIKAKYKREFPSIVIDVEKDRGNIIEQMGELERSFESLFPHLIDEWDFELNGSLLPSHVSPYSRLKVWWRCSKNETHVWESAVSQRSKSQKCPYCLNRRINDSNSLLTLDPEIGKQWHPTKNGDLKPSQVALNYSKKVWWVCAEGHEFEKSPNGRQKRRKCPECIKETKGNKQWQYP